MKDFKYYKAGDDTIPEIMELKEKTWEWKIPEGKKVITKDDLVAITQDLRNFELRGYREIDHLRDDAKKSRTEEFYLDVCSELGVDPESEKVRELFKRAKIDNPFSITLLYERFTKDIRFFIL